MQQVAHDIDKIQRMLGKKTKVSPKLLGYAMVNLAAGHADSLEKASVLAQGVDEALLCELLRAYFCFASLWVGGHIQDDMSLNLYGASMLEELRDYPDKLGVLVRGAFADEAAIDEAVACYVRGAPSDMDRAAIQENRRLLILSEDNPIHFFAGKVHIRTMRIANVDRRTTEFLLAWTTTAAFVTNTAKSFFSEIVPVSAE
jgi:hypothetical protein